MDHGLTGAWKLVAWRRIASDKSVTYPLGDDAHGLLIYTADGHMAVQMTAAHRPPVAEGDPLGGDVDKRAAAYSTCLAYFGRYEVRDGQVVHRIDTSLYPGWTGQEQVRPFTCDGTHLVLHTPPTQIGGRTVVNEMAWERAP